MKKQKLTRDQKSFLRRAGFKVSDRMKEIGATPETVAEHAEIARSTVREIVAGRSNARVVNLRKIVETLGWPSLGAFLIELEG